MKDLVVKALAILGFIFLIILMIGVYFFITDPYDLKPLLFGETNVMQREDGVVAADTVTGPDEEKVATTTNTSTSTQFAVGFDLSPEQVETLISLGVDPAAVPASVSAEQATCFVDVLGEDRVEEVKAGSIPSPLEFLRVKSCL